MNILGGLASALGFGDDDPPPAKTSGSGESDPTVAAHIAKIQAGINNLDPNSFQALIPKVNGSIGRAAGLSGDDPSVLLALAAGLGQGAPLGTRPSFMGDLARGAAAAQPAVVKHNELALQTPEALAKNFATARSMGMITPEAAATIPGMNEYTPGARYGQPAMGAPGAGKLAGFAAAGQSGGAPPNGGIAAPGGAQSGGITPYDGIFQKVSQQVGMPLHLLMGIAAQENSKFDASAVTRGQNNESHATGLMQMQPSTYAGVAKQYGLPENGLTDPYYNVLAGALYAKDMYKRYGSWEKGIEAYHDGPGAYDTYLRSVNPATGRPMMSRSAESSGYLQGVMGNAQRVSQALSQRGSGSAPSPQAGGYPSAAGGVTPQGARIASNLNTAKMYQDYGMIPEAVQMNTLAAKEPNLVGVNPATGGMYTEPQVVAAGATKKAAETEAENPGLYQRAANAASLEQIPVKGQHGDVNVNKLQLAGAQNSGNPENVNTVYNASAGRTPGNTASPDPARPVQLTPLNKPFVPPAPEPRPTVGQDPMDAGNIAELNKTRAAAQTAADTADKNIARITRIQSNMDQFTTGPAAEFKKLVGRWAPVFGADPTAITSSLGSPQAAEQLSKDFFKLSLGSLKEDTTGKEPGFIIKMTAENNPSIDMLPESTKLMIAAMKQEEIRDKDRNEALANWIGAGHRSDVGFETAFSRANPPERYYVNGYLSAGMPVPIPTDPASANIVKRLLIQRGSQTGQPTPVIHKVDGKPHNGVYPPPAAKE